jgi:hypothetical protein
MGWAKEPVFSMQEAHFITQSFIGCQGERIARPEGELEKPLTFILRPPDNPAG